jgi:hypothetical protein
VATTKEDLALSRAGKEPAEDVKRAVRRAIKLAGLEVQTVRMLKSLGADGRLVLAAASPVGWRYESPAIGLHVMVRFDGTVDAIQISCTATDGNPLMEVFVAPHLQGCSCRLADLAATLKEVWVARREVIARFQAGEAGPIFDGKWNWTTPDLPSLPDVV